MVSKLCCFRGWFTQKGEYNVQNIEASSAKAWHYVEPPEHGDLGVGALAEVPQRPPKPLPPHAAKDRARGGRGRRRDVRHPTCPKQCSGRTGRNLWSYAITPDKESAETAGESIARNPKIKFQVQNDEENVEGDTNIVISQPTNPTPKLRNVPSASTSSAHAVTQLKTIPSSTRTTLPSKSENSRDNVMRCQETPSSSTSYPTSSASGERATLENDVYSDPGVEQEHGSSHVDQGNEGDDDRKLVAENERDYAAVEKEEEEEVELAEQPQQNEEEEEGAEEEREAEEENEEEDYEEEDYEEDDYEEEDTVDDDATASPHSEIEMEEEDDEEYVSDGQHSSASNSEQIHQQVNSDPETQPSALAEEEDQERPRRLRLYERQSIRRLGEEFVQDLRYLVDGNDYEGLSEAERQEEWSRYLQRTRTNLVHQLQRRIRQQPQERRQNYVHRVVSILESTVSRHGRVGETLADIIIDRGKAPCSERPVPGEPPPNFKLALQF